MFSFNNDMILLMSIDGVVQFITVIVIFIIVLVLTYLTSRFVGGYQKNRYSNGNIQVLEAMTISNNKVLQIVQAGDKCFAIVVCKDTVTLLGEIDKSSLKDKELSSSVYNNFDSVFNLMKNKFKKSENSDKEDR